LDSLNVVVHITCGEFPNYRTVVLLSKKCYLVYAMIYLNLQIRFNAGSPCLTLPLTTLFCFNIDKF